MLNNVGYRITWKDLGIIIFNVFLLEFCDISHDDNFFTKKGIRLIQRIYLKIDG